MAPPKNKIVYRPPDSTKTKLKDIGTREKSQRSKTKIEHFVSFAKPNKKATAKLRKEKLNHWTLIDQHKMLENLKKCGTKLPFDDGSIKKSEAKIRDFILKEKRKVRMKEELKEDAQSDFDTKYVPREINNPIEEWIALVDTAKSQRGNNNIMNCSHLLPDVLEVIANEEKHPLPG
jgi:hypothetical protein